MTTNRVSNEVDRKPFIDLGSLLVEEVIIYRSTK